MGFWSTTTCVPPYYMTLGLFRCVPGYLRIGLPPPPEKTWKHGGTIVKLGPSDYEQVTSLWSNHYCGNDWIFDGSVSRTYLSDSNVVVLGLVHSGELIATIVSTPFSGGRTLMSHGANLECVRVIEGLCVHSAHRSTGVAGFMISHMDSWTATMYGPTVHLWSRELSMEPMFSTALRVDTYAYIECRRAPRRTQVNRMPWDAFCLLWTSNSPHWIRDGPCIVATVPINRRGSLTAWRCGTGNKSNKSNTDIIVVVSHTGRTSELGTIWEVVWCGVLEGTDLRPANGDDTCMEPVTSVASHCANGVLFASSSPTGGGVDTTWLNPWQYGNSGVHAWYIYNYIPPSFGDCTIHAIRDEL